MLFSSPKKKLSPLLLSLLIALFLIPLSPNNPAFGDDPATPTAEEQALELAKTNLEKAQKAVEKAKNDEKEPAQKLAEAKAAVDVIKEGIETIEGEIKTLNEALNEENKKEPKIQETINSLTAKISEKDTALTTQKDELKTKETALTTAEKNYQGATANTADAEQAQKVAYATLQKAEANACDKVADPEKCDKQDLDAQKASQEADQEAYNKDIQDYNICIQACENNPEYLQNTNERELINTCKTGCNIYLLYAQEFEDRKKNILSAEAKLYKYQTLKELTFNVRDTLNINPDEFDAPSENKQAYFDGGKDNPPIFALILSVINFAIKILGSIAVLIIIIGGFILVLSNGNDSRIEQGKNTIKFALVGISIALMSYIIVLFVQAIFSN